MEIISKLSNKQENPRFICVVLFVKNREISAKNAKKVAIWWRE